MRLDVHVRTDLAISLIRRGMRTSIVHQITGVQMVLLRQLHHEIHRRKPASGQLPTSYGVLRTPLMQAYASAFASLYRSLASGDVQSALDTQALIKAHDLYLEQVSDGAASGGQGVRFDVNQAWTIARDLTTGVVRFQFCQRCRVHYAVVDLSTRPLTCPLCVLKRDGKPKSLRRRVGDMASPEDHVTGGATCRLRQEGGRT
jgi:hypothetical protein